MKWFWIVPRTSQGRYQLLKADNPNIASVHDGLSGKAPRLNVELEDRPFKEATEALSQV